MVAGCPAAALIPAIAAAAQDVRAYDVSPGDDPARQRSRMRRFNLALARMEQLWPAVGTTRPSSGPGAMLSLLAAVTKLDDLEVDPPADEDGWHGELVAVRNLIAGAYYVLEAIQGDGGLAAVRDGILYLSRYSLATQEEIEAEHASRAESSQ